MTDLASSPKPLEASDLHIESPFFIQWSPRIEEPAQIYNLSHLAPSQREEFLDILDSIIHDNDFSTPLPDYNVFYRIPEEYLEVYRARKALYTSRLNKLKVLDPALASLIKNDIFTSPFDQVVVVRGPKGHQGATPMPTDLIKNVISTYDHNIDQSLNPQSSFVIHKLYQFAKSVDFFGILTRNDVEENLDKRRSFIQEQLSILDERFFEHKSSTYYSQRFTAPVHPINNNTDFDEAEGPNFVEYMLLLQYMTALSHELEDSDPTIRDAFFYERLAQTLIKDRVEDVFNVDLSDIFTDPTLVKKPLAPLTSLLSPPPLASTRVAENRATIEENVNGQYDKYLQSTPQASSTASWHKPQWLNQHCDLGPRNSPEMAQIASNYGDNHEFMKYLRQNGISGKQIPQSEIQKYYEEFYVKNNNIQGDTNLHLSQNLAFSQKSPTSGDQGTVSDFFYQGKYSNLQHIDGLVPSGHLEDLSHFLLNQDDPVVGNDLLENTENLTEDEYYTDNSDEYDDEHLETSHTIDSALKTTSTLPPTIVPSHKTGALIFSNRNTDAITTELVPIISASPDSPQSATQTLPSLEFSKPSIMDQLTASVERIQAFIDTANATHITKEQQQTKKNHPNFPILPIPPQVMAGLDTISAQTKLEIEELSPQQLNAIKTHYIDFLKQNPHIELSFPQSQPFLAPLPYTLSEAQTVTYNEYVYMLAKYHPQAKELLLSLKMEDPSLASLFEENLADVNAPEYESDRQRFLEIQRQFYGVSKWSQVRTGFLAKHPYLLHLLEYLNGKEEFDYYVGQQQNRITAEIVEMWDKQHVIGQRHVYTKDDDISFARAVYYFENLRRYTYIQAYNEWEIDAKNELRMKLETGLRFEQHLRDTRDRLQYRADVASQKYAQHGVDREGRPKNPKQRQQWYTREGRQGERRERYPPNFDYLDTVSNHDADFLYKKYVQNEFEDALGDPESIHHISDDQPFSRSQHLGIHDQVSLDNLVKRYVLESLPKQARLHPPVRSVVMNNIHAVKNAENTKVDHIFDQTSRPPLDIYEALLFNPQAPLYADGLKIDTYVDVHARMEQHKYPIFQLIHDDNLNAEDVENRKKYEKWLETQRNEIISKRQDARQIFHQSEYYYGTLQKKLLNNLQDRRLRQHNLLLAVLTPKQYDELLEYKGFSLYPKTKAYENGSPQKKPKSTFSSDGLINFSDPKFASISPPPSPEYVDEYENQADINKRFGYTSVELKTPLTSNFQMYAQVKRFQFEKNKLFDEAEAFIKSQIELYGADINQHAIKSNLLNYQSAEEFMTLNASHNAQSPPQNDKNASLATESHKIDEFRPVKPVVQYYGSYLNNIDQIFQAISEGEKNPLFQSSQYVDTYPGDQLSNKSKITKNHKQSQSPSEQEFAYLGWSREQFTPAAFEKFVTFRTEQLLQQWISQNLTKTDLKHFSDQDRSDLRKEFSVTARQEAGRIWGSHMFVPNDLPINEGVGGFINDDEIEGRVLALSPSIEGQYYPLTDAVSDEDIKSFTNTIIRTNTSDEEKREMTAKMSKMGYLEDLSDDINELNELTADFENLPVKPRFRLDREEGDTHYTLSTGQRQIDAELEPLQESDRILQLIRRESMRRERNVRRRQFVTHLSRNFPIKYNPSLIQDEATKATQQLNKDGVTTSGDEHYISPELTETLPSPLVLFPKQLQHHKLYEYKRRLHHNPTEYRRLIVNYIKNIQSAADRKRMTGEFLYILHPELDPKLAYCNYINNLAPREWHVDLDLQHFYHNHLYDYTLFLQNEQNNILEQFNHVFYDGKNISDVASDFNQQGFSKQWYINENDEFVIESHDMAENIENAIMAKLFSISPHDTSNIPQSFKNSMYLPKELNQSPQLSWVCDRTDKLYQDPFVKNYLDIHTHINYPLLQLKRNYLLHHYYITQTNTYYHLVCNMLVKPITTVLKYCLLKPLEFLNKPIGLVQREAQEYFDNTLFPAIHFSTSSTIRSFAPYLAPFLSKYEDYISAMALSNTPAALLEHGSHVLDTISYRKEALKWINYRNATYGNNGQLLLDDNVDLSDPLLKTKLFSTLDKLFLISPELIGNLQSIHNNKYASIFRDNSSVITTNFPQPTRLVYNPYDMTILADTREPLRNHSIISNNNIDIPNAGHATFGLAHNIPDYTHNIDVKTSTPWQNPDLLDLSRLSAPDPAILLPIFHDEMVSKITEDQTQKILARPQTGPIPQSYFAYKYRPGEVIDSLELTSSEQLRLDEEISAGIIQLCPQIDHLGRDTGKSVMQFPMSGIPETSIDHPFVQTTPEALKIHIPLHIYTTLDEFDPMNAIPEEHSIDSCFEHWVIREREKQQHKLNQYALDKAKQNSGLSDGEVLPALPLRLTQYDLMVHRDSLRNDALVEKRENMLKFIHNNYITLKNFKKYNLLKFKDNEEIVHVDGNEIVIRSKNLRQRTFDSHFEQNEKQREIIFAWLDWLKKEQRKKMDKFLIQHQQLHTQIFIDEKSGKIVEKPLTSKQLHRYEKNMQKKLNSSDVDRVDQLLNPEVWYQRSFSPILHDIQRKEEFSEHAKDMFINENRDKLLEKYKHVDFARYIRAFARSAKNPSLYGYKQHDINQIQIGPTNIASQVIQLSSQQKLRNQSNLTEPDGTDDFFTKPSASSLYLIGHGEFLIDPSELSPSGSKLPIPVNTSQSFISEDEYDDEYEYTPEKYKITDNTDFSYSTTFNPYKPSVKKGGISTRPFNFHTMSLSELPENFFSQQSSPQDHYQIYQQSVLSGQHEAHDIATKIKEHKETLEVLKSLVPDDEYNKYLVQFKKRLEFEKHHKTLHNSENTSRGLFATIWPFGTKHPQMTEFYDDEEITKNHKNINKNNSNQNEDFSDWFGSSAVNYSKLDPDSREFLENSKSTSDLPQISPEQRHIIERLISRLFDRSRELHDPTSAPIVMNPDLDALQRQTQLPEANLSYQAFYHRYIRKISQQAFLRSILNKSVDSNGDFDPEQIDQLEYIDPNVKSYDIVDLDDYTEFPHTPLYNELYPQSHDPATITQQMVNYMIFSGNTKGLLDGAEEAYENGDFYLEAGGNPTFSVEQYSRFRQENESVVKPKNQFHWYQRFYNKILDSTFLSFDSKNISGDPNNNSPIKNQLKSYTPEEKSMLFNNQFENSIDLNATSSIHSSEYQTPYVFHKVKQLLTNADKNQYLRHIAYKMDTLSLDIYQLEQLRLDGYFAYHPILDKAAQKKENNIHLVTEQDILNKPRLFLKYYYPDGTPRYDEDKMPHITAKQREENQITLMKAKYKQYQKMMVFIQNDLITVEEYNTWCTENYYNHNDADWFTYLRVYHLLVGVPFVLYAGKGLYDYLSRNIFNPVTTVESTLESMFPVPDVMKKYVLPHITPHQLKIDDDEHVSTLPSSPHSALELHQLSSLASSLTPLTPRDLQDNLQINQNDEDSVIYHKAFGAVLDLFQSPFFNNNITQKYDLPHLYKVMLLFALCDTVEKVITTFNDVYPYLQYYYGDVFGPSNDDHNNITDPHDVRRQLWLQWFILVTSAQHSDDKYQQLTQKYAEKVANSANTDNHAHNNYLIDFYTIHDQLLRSYETPHNKHTNIYITHQNAHLFTAWIQLENIVNCVSSILSQEQRYKLEVLQLMLFEWQPILSVFVLPYDLFSQNDNFEESTENLNIYHHVELCITQYNMFMLSIYQQYYVALQRYYNHILSSYDIVVNHFDSRNFERQEKSLDYLNNLILPNLKVAYKNFEKNVVHVGLRNMGAYINTINNTLNLIKTELHESPYSPFHPDNIEEIRDSLNDLRNDIQLVAMHFYSEYIVPTVNHATSEVSEFCGELYNTYISHIVNNNASIGEALFVYQQSFFDMCNSLYSSLTQNQ